MLLVYILLGVAIACCVVLLALLIVTLARHIVALRRAKPPVKGEIAALAVLSTHAIKAEREALDGVCGTTGPARKYELRCRCGKVFSSRISATPWPHAHIAFGILTPPTDLEIAQAEARDEHLAHVARHLTARHLTAKPTR